MITFQKASAFADPPSFPPSSEELRRLVRGRLLDTSNPHKPLRVWVPECATGEDARRVATSLIEAAGRRWREMPLTVFCTDSSEEALFRARGKLLGMRSRIRTSFLFARHDASMPPPFSRLALIAARGTLGGKSARARAAALRAYHSARAPEGVLLDGSGAAADEPELFHPVGRDRAYARVVQTPLPPRESARRTRVLFAEAEDAILVRDAETDVILEATEAAHRLLGWTVSELVGMKGRDLIAAPGSVRRGADERRSEDRLRMPHCRRKDGGTFAADMSAAFLMVEGRPCALWLVRDAAPRMRAGSSRRREKDDAYVDELVHELRSPLAVIRGSVESLRLGAPGPRDRSAFLKFIDNHALRMGRLVDRLLDLSAADPAKRVTRPEPVRLGQSVWDVAAAFIPVAKRRGVRLRIDVAPELAALADPADLPHLVGNLIDNAIKFTPRGGEIRVDGREEGGEAVLTVRDSGAGIAAADLPRLFERFYRGEAGKRAKGTGLGLAIVRALATANRGRVDASNDPRGGAAFRVALPLARLQ
jgi:PAS domain S-box-containing protein